jgi:hypothetical protein
MVVEKLSMKKKWLMNLLDKKNIILEQNEKIKN